MVEQWRHRGRLYAGSAGNAAPFYDRNQSGSILPFVLISGASLLFTILSSSSPPVASCHCPPTNRVVEILGTGPFFHCTCPTIDSYDVSTTDCRSASGSNAFERLSTSAATSNSACLKPRG